MFFLMLTDHNGDSSAPCYSRTVSIKGEHPKSLYGFKVYSLDKGVGLLGKVPWSIMGTSISLMRHSEHSGFFIKEFRV